MMSVWDRSESWCRRQQSRRGEEGGYPAGLAEAAAVKEAVEAVAVAEAALAAAAEEAARM